MTLEDITPATTPSDLDSVLHGPKRLAAMAILRTAVEAEFAYLQRRLDVSASDLSKQMSALVDRGYVAMRKTGHGRGSQTWFKITADGKTAFDDYKAMLRSLLGDA